MLSCLLLTADGLRFAVLHAHRLPGQRGAHCGAHAAAAVARQRSRLDTGQLDLDGRDARLAVLRGARGLLLGAQLVVPRPAHNGRGRRAARREQRRRARRRVPSLRGQRGTYHHYTRTNSRIKRLTS